MMPSMPSRCDMVMAILKDGELDWTTKELIILKATHRNQCQYCVVQHETLSQRLGISEDKIDDAILAV